MILFQEYYDKLSLFLENQIKSDPNWGAPYKLQGKLCACRKAQDLIHLKEEMLICIGSFLVNDKRTIQLLFEFSTILYDVSTYECFYNLIELHLDAYLKDQNPPYLRQAKSMLQKIENMPTNGEIINLKSLIENELNSTNFVVDDKLGQALKCIRDDISSLYVQGSSYFLAIEFHKILKYENIDISSILQLQQLASILSCETQIKSFVTSLKDYIETVKNEWLGGWGKAAEKLIESIESQFWKQDISLLRFFLIDFRDNNLTGYIFKSNRLTEIVGKMIESLPSKRTLTASIGSIPLAIQENVLSNIYFEISPMLSRGYYDIRAMPGYSEFIDMQRSNDKSEQVGNAQTFKNLSL
ncbi:MAG: hypothetical protein U1E78_08035 [Gammaproteobacteria bacterium]